MKRIFKIISLLAAFCMLLAVQPVSSVGELVPVNAEGECGENLTWFYDSALRVLIISGEGVMTDYTYNSRSPWNRYASSIREIVVQEGVTGVGRLAFYNCTAAEAVSLPASLTGLGASAFSGCRALAQIVIPGGVTAIPDGAFEYCRALSAVTLGGSVTSIGNSAFGGCALEAIDLPETLGSIGSEAFSGCYLSTVAIPDGVTYLGEYAFDNCNDLVSASIGAGLTDSSAILCAFEQCPALERFVVSPANPALSDVDGVLMSRDGSKLIRFPRGKAGDYTVPPCVTTIAENAFSYCSSVGAVVVPDTVTVLERRAFYRCDSMTSVSVGDGVTEILDSTFYDCGELTSAVIGSGVVSVGENVFTNCNSLESITFGSGLERFGSSYLLDNCSALRSIIFLGAPPTAYGSTFPQDMYCLTFYYTPAYAAEWAPYGGTFCGYPLVMTEGPGPVVITGDINGDGELGFTDVSALYGYALGLSDTELPLDVADINADGEITFADVGVLYAMIIG